jgi:hypothetical protein
VRGSILPSMSSWSQAATYQQFFMNMGFSSGQAPARLAM